MRRLLVAAAPARAWVDAPVWSPDDTLVAYTRGAVGLGAPRLTCSTLVRAPGVGGPERPFANLPGRCPSDLAWGARLAFHADDGLAVAGVDGTGARRIADDGREPAWSPDGARIAYVDGTDVNVVAADGSGDVDPGGLGAALGA